MSDFLPRDIFDFEQDLFREQVRKFVETEVTPHHEAWEHEGMVPRDLWRKAGENGFLCCEVGEDYGGVGAGFLYDCIVYEELGYAHATGPGFWLTSSLVAPYLLHYGTEEQRQRWLPGLVAGEQIAGIAMTEPGAGSDLQNIRTTARRDGDHYVLNGQKTFISNGQASDLIIVAAKTDTTVAGAKGTSLFLVPSDAPGFRRGRNLKKLGHKAQDTSELFFEDIALPADALLGEENAGFKYLMMELPQERLVIAVFCMARAEAALKLAIDYTKEREAFGGRLFDLQTIRHTLANLTTEVQVGRAYVDRLMKMHSEQGLTPAQASAAKLWVTEMLGRVVDQSLQLFGGYGYMLEYPISKAFADARLERIYGGTSEIMRELIGRSLEKMN